MSTDLYGWLECKPGPGRYGAEHASWEPFSELRHLHWARDYMSWSALFDVRSVEPVEALFPDRGAPADLSETVRRDADDFEGHSHSWFSWRELSAVDWSAPCTDGPSRYWVRRWSRTQEGSLEPEGLAALPDELYDSAAATFGDGNIAPSRWPADGELPLGSDVYRPVVPAYRDLVPADGPWRPVWNVMGTLAELHGEDNVRLVVWFGG
ncbi:hypothetical protein [Streptomyces sp. WAC04114]|uniref:hypothetical protein n=1 Tax=Streptomyces sp. WAC04114 TaxID=2867961 RepID=UPI001C8B5135|nr:hypothetical protein [Streptomyces sp. WAC04114]MBX9366703.1 hypothetical protein [Streptomyces sp. WAC04114]